MATMAGTYVRLSTMKALAALLSKMTPRLDVIPDRELSVATPLRPQQIRLRGFVTTILSAPVSKSPSHEGVAIMSFEFISTWRSFR